MEENRYSLESLSSVGGGGGGRVNGVVGKMRVSEKEEAEKGDEDLETRRFLYNVLAEKEGRKRTRDTWGVDGGFEEGGCLSETQWERRTTQPGSRDSLEHILAHLHRKASRLPRLVS